MLNINVPLTLVAVVPIPFIYVVGVRMRELMFPISWVVQGAHRRRGDDRRGERHRARGS